MSRSSEQCSVLMRSLLLAYGSAVGEALGESGSLPFLPISVCHFYLLLWRSGSAISWLLFRGNCSIYSCRLVFGEKGWVQDFPLPAYWTAFSCMCFLFQEKSQSMLCLPIFSPLSTHTFLGDKVGANCGDPRTKEQIKSRRVLECPNGKTRPLLSLPPPCCNY